MQLPANAPEATRENHHCDNQYRIDTQCYGLPPPRISVASGTLSQGCKDGGSTARPSARRWRMTPSLGKVRHGNHQNPQGNEEPQPERCSYQQTCVHFAFPFIRARLTPRASAETPSTSRPTTCSEKTVMGGHPFIAAPSEPRFWASQGPCFCLDQPRPAAPS